MTDVVENATLTRMLEAKLRARGWTLVDSVQARRDRMLGAWSFAVDNPIDLARSHAYVEQMYQGIVELYESNRPRRIYVWRVEETSPNVLTANLMVRPDDHVIRGWVNQIPE